MEDEIKYILEKTKNILNNIAQEHNATDKEVCIRFHPKLVTIDVKGEPLYHFFDEHDLIKCIIGETPHEINKK